jgi:hypothetical protein
MALRASGKALVLPSSPANGSTWATNNSAELSLELLEMLRGARCSRDCPIWFIDLFEGQGCIPAGEPSQTAVYGSELSWQKWSSDQIVILIQINVRHSGTPPTTV